MSEAADLETAFPSKGQAGADPYSIPLEKIDVTDSELWSTDTHWGYFERLRSEAPVHYCADSEFGRYWSVTTFDHIVEVEKDPETYSSEPTITVGDIPEDSVTQNAGFITMDGPRHTAHRKVAQPVSSPRNIKALEPIVRERSIAILDSLPIGETFDWVDKVSIELTTAMLATMFDFDWETRRKLTYWSDMATISDEQLAEEGLTSRDRENAMLECLEAFTKLWNERRGKETGTLDFVSALANADATSDMDPAVDPVTYIGTLMLLIVGGNDTTRNTISGGVMALNEFPEQYEKLRNDRSLIPTFVDEAIRWQTPLAHMRRTATRDTILGGQQIKKGDKIVMWYVSANRDETAIERASEFLIDRADAKRHLSFGWGKHFCMGSRIAEMQVRVLWEEILERFRKIEVVGEPQRVRSCFVKGYKSLPVRVHPW